MSGSSAPRRCHPTSSADPGPSARLSTAGSRSSTQRPLMARVGPRRSSAGPRALGAPRSRHPRHQGRPRVAERRQRGPEREPRTNHEGDQRLAPASPHEYVDIYQVHWPDPLVPLQETRKRSTRCTETGASVRSGSATTSPSRWRRSARSRLSTRAAALQPVRKGGEEEVLPYCQRTTSQP